MDEWEKWRAENRRLSREGWMLSTYYLGDGSVEHWATKEGVELRVDPPRIEKME